MIIFVSGIHTDAGKSYAAGWLAREFAKQGVSVITQKFIQTGNVGSSEDIEVHRRIMGVGQLPEDAQGLTAPQIFSYPCSPQLAAEIDGREIDFNAIDKAMEELDSRYDVVLLEGAGGLMVPLTDDFWTIDYIASRGLPVALVTNGTLGSINHTLLSLEALERRAIPLHSVIYNQHFDSRDRRIADDTVNFIRRYLERRHPSTPLMFCPSL
ncbi:MAG: ATP-dependent dethiobiotin synthetase BioD [Bacteroidales bacterium]|nr:ATP-dependent dethiobiotin synthetase BioD [Bacteroidales bacterium]MBD5282505.1 ATP-dependent dethiobiotin synthetase BioD [Bacteroides sp.]MBD5293669.1 ATP-dependent dethiobiotin synthetase BioD [Bacteroides sp.]MBD5342830.1 ATP-dependent dethiobiotin synthetase BioD [Bacteroides sp.]MBD5352913.1 ATP-dependent dethiobiotin synthetase BioD [Bacteroides sp.]